MRIVFWENIVSQHKLPYWIELARNKKVSDFILVVQEDLPESLIKNGWENTLSKSHGPKIIFSPNIEQIKHILEKEITNSYHVFSGIRAFPMVYNAFNLSRNYPVKRILLTESLNMYGKRALTRRLAALLIERRYLKHYDLVLGSGSNTKTWYLENGLKPSCFYPFMYTVNTPERLDENLPTDILRFVFVGQLIKRKGLDLLLKALAQISHKNWILDIYGTGSDENTYKTLSTKLDVSDKVSFKGVLKNSELQSSLQNYHTLVLPSRFDGWGAVVNEAIAAGTRVLCSDHCGASVLLINQQIGMTFKSGNIKSLVKGLNTQIEEINNFERKTILEFCNKLTGEKVADYFLDIIKFHYHKAGSRPLAPWLNNSEYEH
ncbi:glycosyltransferase [Saccharicrinis sp. FJH54]|uniref:glycosyltransferase n=1 Tax=Saccharicrinis sp. FJH54 TaxID=3344665 RepID=UPI0035D3F444